MLTSQQMLDAYHQMYDLSCKMYLSASSSLWDEFIVLEQERSKILNFLQQNKSLELKLEGDDHTQLEAVCTLIVEEDQKILPLMHRWMNDISNMLQSSQTENNIRKAYDNNLDY